MHQSSILKVIKLVQRLTLKSIVFNFKYLPFKDAIKLPFIVSNKVVFLKLSGNIKILGPIKTGMIQIGHDYGEGALFDKKNNRSVWQVEGTIIFKGTARIGYGSKIYVSKNGVLELGDNFVITSLTTIMAQKRITFGDNCLVSWECLFMDTDFHKIKDENQNVINPNKSITIGNNVWFGCRNSILKGTKIASNSVIGANSVVSKDISNTPGVYVGNPITLTKEKVTWEY